MVVEIAVEDAGLTRLQLLSMIDSVISAAEIWQAVVGRGGETRKTSTSKTSTSMPGEMDCCDAA